MRLGCSGFARRGGCAPPCGGRGGSGLPFSARSPFFFRSGLAGAKSAPPPWCAPVGAVFKRRRSRRLFCCRLGRTVSELMFYIYAPNSSLAQLHYILCRKGVAAAWSEQRSAIFLCCDLTQRPRRESARTACIIGTKNAVSDKLHKGENFLLTRVFESSKKAIF